MRLLLLLIPLLALTSCDPVDEGQTAAVAKTRYSFAFHQRVSAPMNQPNIYLTDLHDADTGVDYLIVQDSHGLVVVPLPPKTAEKAAQASTKGE